MSHKHLNAIFGSLMSHKHLNAIFGLRGYKRIGKKSLHVEIQQFMYF